MKKAGVPIEGEGTPEKWIEGPGEDTVKTWPPTIPGQDSGNYTANTVIWGFEP